MCMGNLVPIIDEQPGPPLNHAAKGAVDGLLRASKNLMMGKFRKFWFGKVS
jgi:hypothetical protein